MRALSALPAAVWQSMRNKTTTRKSPANWETLCDVLDEMNIKLDDTAVVVGTKAPAVSNAKVKKLEAKCAELRRQLSDVQPPVLGLNSFKPTSTDQCDV